MKKSSRTLRWAITVWALFWAVLNLLMAGGGGAIGWVTHLPQLVIVVALCALCWWRPLIGGLSLAAGGFAGWFLLSGWFPLALLAAPAVLLGLGLAAITGMKGLEKPGSISTG